MPPSALIIGCGYQGRAVAKRWLAAGWRVSALTRSKPAELENLGITPVVGDVTNPGSLVLPAADCVLYAVGMDRTAGKSMREVYLDGLANVLDRLPSGGTFIYISSTSVYVQTDGEWVDETSATEPVEESGRLILECEHLLRARRPDAIILRFAGMYGPGRMIHRAAIERGDPIGGNPDKWLNLIHQHDGAAVIDAVSAHPKPGDIFNVSDGTPVLRRDFFTRMAEMLNAPPVRFAPPSQQSQEGSNRRISNKKLHDGYFVEFKFPDYESGLRGLSG